MNRSVILTALVLLVSGQASAASSSHEYYAAMDTQVNAISDNELSAQITDALSSGIFMKGFDQVSFKINNGIVVLQGIVPSMDDKMKVERTVRGIEGVRDVKNEITVQE